MQLLIKRVTDLAKANQILTQAGYAKNANGMYAKDGKELELPLLFGGKTQAYTKKFNKN